MSQTILHVRDLSVTLMTHQGAVYAVDGADFAIPAGKTYALLGESGCGKSMTALAIMRLLPPIATTAKHSHIFLNDIDLLQQTEAQMRQIRGGRISMIFQEPMTSLNPVLTIGQQIEESLILHTDLSSRARKERIVELLATVKIPHPKRRIHEYPHQLSGGMKQRVMIAIALASEPELLIADEPTTALDVTTQAQLLALLAKLQDEYGMAMLLITHDLGVVKQMADYIGVMYAGHLVEQAPVKQFFAHPAHPYSQLLFSALPSLEKRHLSLENIKGSVPTLTKRLTACRFAERCPYVWDLCRQVAPPWYQAGQKTEQASVRCHLYAHTSEPEVTKAEQVQLAAAKLTTNDAEVLLQVEDLKVHFPIRKGFLRRVVDYVPAVDGVSLNLLSGKTLAIVGESGSGKTTLGRSIVSLISPSAGRILYRGQTIITQRSYRRLNISREIQVIFQDPFSALNPRMLVGDVIQEGMLAHGIGANQAERDERAVALLEQVGLAVDSKARYPHEFSGGQRQRIAIARALAVGPKVLICDEPTSALDVSIQAQILNLLRALQIKNNLSYVFISHNLAVVAYLADEIAVMKKGRFVEQGIAKEILTKPKHPYTQALLAAT